MPAPGNVWAVDSWHEDAWGADTWDDAVEDTSPTIGAQVRLGYTGMAVRGFRMIPFLLLLRGLR